MNEIVDQHIETLRRKYGSAFVSDRRPDGTRLVTIPEFPLPNGWNKRSTRVVFVVPLGFPVARPDSFWTNRDLRLSTGAIPTNTAENTNYGGTEPLLWFSFHAQHWNPAADSLLTYANIIRRRLHDLR